MSSRQRAEAADKAIERGKKAFLDGQPITANPYKKPNYSDRGLGSVGYSGGWSLYVFWNLGYTRAKAESPASPK